MDDIDIIAAFEQDFSTQIPERPEQRDSYKYGYFDMCNNQGSVIGRLLVDANGKIFRRLDGLTTGYLPIVGKNDENIYIRVANKSNFKGHYELTPDQEKLLDGIQNLLDDHWDHFYETLKFRNSYQVYMFYMMIQFYSRNWDNTEETFTSPRPTVMVHRSARFLDTFKTAVNENHKARGEKDWLKSYADRIITEKEYHMTQISTIRPPSGGGYNTSVNFNELPGRKIPISQSDLDEASDLYNEYVSVTSFNDEYYQNVYDNLLRYCEELDKNTVIVDYEKPKVN